MKKRGKNLSPRNRKADRTVKCNPYVWEDNELLGFVCACFLLYFAGAPIIYL
jgi:hypothetical protein